MDRRDFLKSSAAALPLSMSAYAAGSDVIRIGMIGCGGRCTEAAAQMMFADKGVKLVAMSDVLLSRIHEKRAKLKADFPDQVAVDDAHCFSGFSGYKDVINSVDAVLIANAAKFHPMHAMAAVQAGKHVFVEKPHGIDPAGLKVMRAAAELAAQKKLSFLSGLQSRYFPGYRETVQRIHDGAIGNIIAVQETWLRAPYVLYERKPGMSELEYQGSNQYHFHWLSGDDFPQTLIHNLDRASWAMKGAVPIKCWGMGGRSTLKGEIYGNVFDHHSAVFEFPDNVRLYAACRTIPNCYEENSSIILGSKGRAFLTQSRIEGETNWKWEHAGKRVWDIPALNPYNIEQAEFAKSIRTGNPINSGDYMIRSTTIGIMGQIACYSGKQVTWDQMVASNLTFGPKPEDVHDKMEPPVKPGPGGIYPLPFTPGESTLL